MIRTNLRKCCSAIAALGLAFLPGAWAGEISVGFETSEGYTNGQPPPAPWSYRGGNDTPTDQVRVTNALAHSGSQSLGITPNFGDTAVYPVTVPPGASARFSVWVRPSNHTFNEVMGGVSVVSFHPNNVWKSGSGVSFNANFFVNPMPGSTILNLTFGTDGAAASHMGDFTPHTWYLVEVEITPTEYIFTVTVDTGTHVHHFARNEGWTVKEITFDYAVQTVFYDDFRYTPPAQPVTLTVQSAYGTPSPTVGIHNYFAGDTVNCQAASVTNGLTNYSASGWTLTGHTPASGTGSQCTLTLTNDAVLTWLWQTNYWLEASVAGQGGVNPGSGWYAAGSGPTLAAVPAADWLFMGWSGDLSGGYTENEASLVINAPKSVTATFSQDADGDGLTNALETILGTNPRHPDTDGDGFDDFFEVQVGLSPTNDSSVVRNYIRDRSDTFGLYSSNVVLNLAAGQMLLQVQSGEARLQLQLLQSDNLIHWTNAGNAVEWTRPVAPGQKYFRVQAKP